MEKLLAMHVAAQLTQARMKQSSSPQVMVLNRLAFELSFKFVPGTGDARRACRVLVGVGGWRDGAVGSASVVRRFLVGA